MVSKRSPPKAKEKKDGFLSGSRLVGSPNSGITKLARKILDGLYDELAQNASVIHHPNHYPDRKPRQAVVTVRGSDLAKFARRLSKTPVGKIAQKSAPRIQNRTNSRTLKQPMKDNSPVNCSGLSLQRNFQMIVFKFSPNNVVESWHRCESVEIANSDKYFCFIIYINFNYLYLVLFSCLCHYIFSCINIDCRYCLILRESCPFYCNLVLVLSTAENMLPK